MDEMILLESHTLRNQLCTDRNAQILDKFGELITLPDTDWVTTEYLALFFGVPEATIRKIVERYRVEISEDGYIVLSAMEFKEKYNMTVGARSRSIAIFSRRASLRIGMVLQDSAIAGQIRSYLLDIEQNAQIETTQKALTTMANRLTHHSLQLAKQAKELEEQSMQLSKNAGELSAQARHSLNQDRIITAIVSELNKNRETLDGLQLTVDNQQEVMQKFEHRLSALEDNTPNPEVDLPITREQAKILKEKVSQKGRPISIWARFKKHFSLARYIHLPQSRFEEALQ